MGDGGMTAVVYKSIQLCSLCEQREGALTVIIDGCPVDVCQECYDEGTEAEKGQDEDAG